MADGLSRTDLGSLAPELVPGAIPLRLFEQRLALSRDNYEFNPGAQHWRLNKEVTIHVALVLERLAPRLREPYRRLLQFHAEHYSPAYCTGIHQGVEKLLKDTSADGFSESVLRTYRASLGRANESRLGTIRAFLTRWHDQGYPGVSSAAVEFLASVTLKGNEKGAAVLSLDPRQGPFDDQEIEAILDAVSQQYERRTVDLAILALTLLLAHTGRRPGQLTLLRVGDLQRSPSVDGRSADTVRIPRSKLRGRAPRSQFKTFWLSSEVSRVLTAQRDRVIQSTEDCLGPLPAPLVSELPLFPASRRLEQIRSAAELEEAVRTDVLHLTTSALRAGLGKLDAVSLRTGDTVHVTPRRFRYTLGTRAAREGYGSLVLAELLDHSDVQSVVVYTRDHPNFRRKIDDAVGQQLVPLARAFAGQLVDSEAKARHGHNPSMRVGTRENQVGTCGSTGFCGAQAYACYTCLHFQPWLDAPHEKVLQWFLRERQRVLAAGASPNVVASTDRSIAAAQSVIAACEARRAEIAGARS